MTRPPDLTDRTALTRNRGRASKTAMFLQDAAADEIKERLSLVNRVFTNPAVVTPFPEIWREKMPQARLVADAEVLDLAEGAHDLVVHGLALHWANDPVGQLIQARRALRPDGLLLATAFGGQTLVELRACLAEAEAAVTGGLSPRVAPMAEIRDMGALLQRAGFALPVADSAVLTVTYETAFHLMRDLRAMGEASALAARPRHFTRRAVLQQAAQRYARVYAGPDGRIPATFEIICLTGWAPDASQPQPLRPGSATTRLADALGAADVSSDPPGST